ncbi:MAG: DUF1704 domain-containing protein, partial [Bdellovibrionales bacterium]|nr:DUF1704 domain-containing protein [Bdellovibrionales bacterium]
MVWKTYKEKLKKLSSAIVTAQQPIRILESIKWPAQTEEFIIKSKFKELPSIERENYLDTPLGYDPHKKIEEFESIVQEIHSQLGPHDPLGRHMKLACQEYQVVIRMLLARGTKEFYSFSRQLYGSPKDTFKDGETRVREVAQLMYEILSGIDDNQLGRQYEKNISAQDTVDQLNDRFRAYFVDDPVRARLSDGILADAAAGSDYIKIKSEAFFSPKDIQILEVHEGWVHVGTTLNGLKQHLCTHLSKGPPRTTATQEGLAVLMELFTFSSYPRRARSINDRVLAIDKAEDGADALELIEFFRTEGYSESESLKNCQRTLRGGNLKGGSPFTKDISYVRGFVENYNFIRS